MNTADPTTIDVVIYHNPACGTSRNALALLRNAGIEPHVIEYLKTPPNSALLKRLAARMNQPLRSILREKGTPYADLDLGRANITDDEILAAIAKHPILINRPIVVTPWGVRLCRPLETLHEILPVAQPGAFAGAAGAPAVERKGRRAK